MDSDGSGNGDMMSTGPIDNQGLLNAPPRSATTPSSTGGDSARNKRNVSFFFKAHLAAQTAQGEGGTGMSASPSGSSIAEVVARLMVQRENEKNAERDKLDGAVSPGGSASPRSGSPRSGTSPASSSRTALSPRMLLAAAALPPSNTATTDTSSSAKKAGAEVDRAEDGDVSSDDEAGSAHRERAGSGSPDGSASGSPPHASPRSPTTARKSVRLLLAAKPSRLRRILDKALLSSKEKKVATTLRKPSTTTLREIASMLKSGTHTEGLSESLLGRDNHPRGGHTSAESRLTTLKRRWRFVRNSVVDPVVLRAVRNREKLFYRLFEWFAPPIAPAGNNVDGEGGDGAFELASRRPGERKEWRTFGTEEDEMDPYGLFRDFDPDAVVAQQREQSGRSSSRRQREQGELLAKMGLLGGTNIAGKRAVSSVSGVVGRGVSGVVGGAAATVAAQQQRSSRRQRGELSVRPPWCAGGKVGLVGIAGKRAVSSVVVGGGAAVVAGAHAHAEDHSSRDSSACPSSRPSYGAGSANTTSSEGASSAMICDYSSSVMRAGADFRCSEVLGRSRIFKFTHSLDHTDTAAALPHTQDYLISHTCPNVSACITGLVHCSVQSNTRSIRGSRDSSAGPSSTQTLLCWVCNFLGGGRCDQ